MTMKSDTTSGREKVIITSPDATEYRIRDLSPGEQYSIEVRYYYSIMLAEFEQIFYQLIYRDGFFGS